MNANKIVKAGVTFMLIGAVVVVTSKMLRKLDPTLF